MSSRAAVETERPGQVADAILLASGLRKSFQMGESTVEVLKNVDLIIRPGEFVAIEGRSGSGKSTLLHILGGLDAADSGTVTFDEEDIGELARQAALERRKFGERATRWKLLMPLIAVFNFGVAVYFLIAFALTLAFGARADKRLARVRNAHFGFVFQFYHLLPELNVVENTMLASMIGNSTSQFRAKRSDLRKRAVEVLTQLGMEHRLDHRPNQLSGGERQRVAIARALMNSPKVLFADEPTGNLDAETGKQIMGVFEELHQTRGQTIVMVTHDRTLARRADRVLVLTAGRIERATDASPA